MYPCFFLFFLKKNSDLLIYYSNVFESLMYFNTFFPGLYMIYLFFSPAILCNENLESDRENEDGFIIFFVCKWATMAGMKIDHRITWNREGSFNQLSYLPLLRWSHRYLYYFDDLVNFTNSRVSQRSVLFIFIMFWYKLC